MQLPVTGLLASRVRLHREEQVGLVSPQPSQVSGQQSAPAGSDMLNSPVLKGMAWPGDRPSECP